MSNLLLDIELWMSGRLQDIDDTLKVGMSINRKGVKVGDITVEDEKFMKSRILELLRSKGKYLVCKIELVPWHKGKRQLILDSEKIYYLFTVSNKHIEISSTEYGLPFSIVNNGNGHWLVEGFEDKASAELFIEMGGFDNE